MAASMLRAVSALCVESQALELCSAARRDVFKVFRTALSSSAPAAVGQTVLSSESAAPPPPASPPPPPPGGPHEPHGPGGPRGASPPPRRAWPAAALAFALTSLGGVYFYRKLNEDNKGELQKSEEAVSSDAGAPAQDADPPYPTSGAEFPPHVEYLLIGAGTASFAAMRAIRAARPASRVLIVGEERALPYMRPPLSKELWREPDLARRADEADDLTFRQWNGKRRSVVYEPSAFYTPVERLAGAETGGAAVARGWRVARIDVARHEAELTAPGRPSAVVAYDKCLVATGARPRRLPALRAAAAQGRALTLRSLRDAARLARALDAPGTNTVAVVGGGFLATELSAALADRLRDTGKEVVQVVGESAPMAGVLPSYLAHDAARRLAATGVRVVVDAELKDCHEVDGRLRLSVNGDRHVDADLVVECAGAEPDTALAEASGLETHPALGGLLVNAELQARSDVYAAGDAACFFDVALGRRRVEHHDHAVVSGRLAGENMAAVQPPKHYTHQSMFWSDLGPQLGYEGIGIVDSRLPTVGVFSADAVSTEASVVEPRSTATEGPDQPAASAPAASVAPAEARRYERGVVFYLRDRRVVGVLLWNLFNRMHLARQVLAQGEFDDLFEVGKLFAPHEEE